MFVALSVLSMFLTTATIFANQALVAVWKRASQNNFNDKTPHLPVLANKNEQERN